jgi:hypothetical protein
VATFAAAGLVVAIASWHHAVTLDNGAVVHGQPDVGLVLAAGAFAALFAVAVGMLVPDWSAAWPLDGSVGRRLRPRPGAAGTSAAPADGSRQKE